MKRLIAISTLLALAGTAFGQSFNIDINRSSGNGAGVPSSAYGAAAGQPGAWTDVNSAGSATTFLKTLAGGSSGVTITRGVSGMTASTFDGVFDSGASGDAAKLLLDFERLDAFGTLIYTVDGLLPGTYAVFTYSVSPGDASHKSGVTVTGTTSAYQYSGGDLVSSSLTPGVTHAIHIVTIAPGDPLKVRVSDSINGTAKCSAIQIRKIDSARLRFYVDDSAAGATDGASWATALPSLQTAVTAASAVGGSRCEIWAAGGTYRPTTGTDRSATFDIPSGLRMYGGFAGDETTLAERTLPIFLSSIMSGAIGGSAQTDNTYTVVTMENCASDTLVDGFSIGRGNNTDSGKGGGFRIIGGSPRISHCRILSNWASLDGAGVYSRDASPVFSNCTFFDGDSGGTGGAIFQSNSGTLNVYNCEFLGNHADGEGGAIKILFADAFVAGSFFSGNDTSFSNGGAVSIGGDSGVDPWFANCTFSKNHAAGTSGGLYIAGGADVTLNNSVFWGNTDAVPNTLKDEQAFASGGSGSLMTTSRTTIQGASGALDPLFVDADGANGVAGDADDDCRLQPGSPAIDSGDNSLLPLDGGDVDFDGVTFETLPLDQNYQTRKVDDPSAPDTGSGTGAIVDRGCYEVQYSPPPCVVDLNGDGLVDFSDYLEFLNLYEAQDPRVDFNQDGLVDFSDYLEFLNLYDTGC
ncbi:MAG: hypothetical protein IT436_03115 [Phycisphaerales bacterium]|nr:hypothetical protein [Phycisphaerales bacterium]